QKQSQTWSYLGLILVLVFICSSSIICAYFGCIGCITCIGYIGIICNTLFIFIIFIFSSSLISLIIVIFGNRLIIVITLIIITFSNTFFRYIPVISLITFTNPIILSQLKYFFKRFTFLNHFNCI